MANYRIKKYYSVIGHSPNIVELRWGVWNPVSFTVSDDAESSHLFNLIKRLDGSSSVADIARQEDVPRSEVEGLIDHLISINAIEEGSENALDYYLDTCLPTSQVQKPKDTTQRVVLIGDPDIARCVASHLQADRAPMDVMVADPESVTVRTLLNPDVSWHSHGVRFYETLDLFEDWKDALVVSVSRVVKPHLGQSLSKIAHALHFPVIHAAIDGPFLVIGPTVIPERTSCYECFETRIVMNMRENGGYQSYKNAILEGNVQLAGLPFLNALDGLLASHVALEIINLTITGTNFTANKALTIHLPTMEFCFHDVLKLPSCTTCGSVPERDDQELYIDLKSMVSG